MAFYLVHAGSTLYKVDVNGAAEAITLPAGVTVSASLPCRFAMLNRQIVVVHGVSKNVQIDGNLVARLLVPATPSAGPIAATGAAGALTGGYRYKVSFRIKDGTRVVSESALSDASNLVSPTADAVDLTAIPVSTDPGVNARAIYRTASDGTEYFFVTEITNNTATTYTDDATDDDIELFPADEDLGAPDGTYTTSRLERVVAWRDRIWALASELPDRVYYSGLLLPYAMSQDNYLTAKPEGEDTEGGTGFAPRRDELGVGKRRSLWKIIGTDADNFQMIRVHADVGIWAPDSVVIIRDEAYFLGEDGVYKWGPGGLESLTRDSVHPWFTEDTTFNRALFSSAFAKYNQKYDSYELHLAAAGSSDFDRWISYNIKAKLWLGPHLTDACTPTAATVLEDNDGLVVPAIGASNGILYKQNQPNFSDNGSAIDFNVLTKALSAGEPEAEKYWGELTVFTKEETSGTLTIRPRVGRLDALTGTISVASMTRTTDGDGLTTVAVITSTPHEFGTGEDILIAGADQADYNGTHTITRTGASTFTYLIGTATPVTPATGTITALHPLRAEISHDLTLERERLRRLGVGRFCQLEFEQDDLGIGVELRGFEIDPVHPIGRR